MLVVNLKGVLVVAGLHQRVSKGDNGGQVVVNREQLVRDRARIGKASYLQVGLQQIAEAVGIGVQISDFLQRFDRVFGVARFDQILALHQERISVARIE